MRWHVAAVWLVVLGWCGNSFIIAQPVGSLDADEDQPTLSNILIRNLQLQAINGEYDPIAAWQGRLKRQNNHHHHHQSGSNPNSINNNNNIFDSRSNNLIENRNNNFLENRNINANTNNNNNVNANGNGNGQMPLLSISSPIEALRARLRLEMIRRAADHQIKENKKLLDGLGKRRKRSAISPSDPFGSNGAAEAAIKAP